MELLKPFRYERPRSLEELAQLLSSSTGLKKVFLAGGTDLLVNMRKGDDVPELMIDLKSLPGLAGIRKAEGNRLWIGALTTIHSLETDEAVNQWATVLAEGATNLGSLQVRNRGTIGGNLANGAPTADTAAPVLALGGRIQIWGPSGERTVPAESFWLGAGKTCLAEDEIITGIEIPIIEGSTSGYQKLGPRRAMDIAIASAAVVIKTRQNIIEEIRIALGGAGPTPIRATAAENYLVGKPVNQEHLRKACVLATEGSNPRSSSRASREYRLSVIPSLVERAIQAALNRQEKLQQMGGKV